MRQQARAMPPSAPATSPFPKLRSTRRVVLAPARRLALAQPSTPISMGTQVAPLVARRLEPGLARRARRCRAMRLTRRRRRSCGRRLRRHRTQQYHRRRLHRTRPHHRLHRRTWPPHRRHRSASLPLRRRHDPPRRRAPRRLPPKSARRINQSARAATVTCARSSCKLPRSLRFCRRWPKHGFGGLARSWRSAAVLSASQVSTPAALKRIMRPFCCCTMRR